MMPTKIELSWLAGIVDGEGHILIRKSQGGYHQLRMGITNTDEGIITHCRNILTKMNVFFSVQQRKSGLSKLSKLPIYSIDVNRINETKYVLRTIGPFLRHSGKIKKCLHALHDCENHIRKDGRRFNVKKHTEPSEQLRLIAGG